MDDKLAPSIAGTISYSSTKALAKAIFEGKIPDKELRKLPIQSLYMAAKQIGISSAGELISTLGREKRSVLLDFDIWEGDRFKEENLWEWFALPEENNEIGILKDIVASLDLKLLAILITRYVKVEAFEEPTDNPPAPGYFTPDKGRTWLFITINDATKHFLLGRILALIFEENAGLFYNLLSIPGVATESALEEESYNEKCKRLLAEGIPDREEAFRVNSPLSEEVALAEIRRGAKYTEVIDVPVVSPLIYDSRTLNPLAVLLTEAKDSAILEAELCHLLNAALVRWSVNFWEPAEVFAVTQKVKGALNLGLHICMASSATHALAIYEALGLRRLYQVGLERLFWLRKIAAARKKVMGDSLVATDPLAEILAALTEPFPEMPIFVGDDGNFKEENGALLSGRRAIERIEEVELLARFVNGN